MLDNFRCLFIKLKFRKCKWLLCGTYHPLSQNSEYYFNSPDKTSDIYSNYEKILLVGDFITEIAENYISFFYKHELSNLVKEKTFENMQNRSFIDLLPNNNRCAFQQATTVWSGLLYCHKLALTLLKMSIPKANLGQFTYRAYKNLNSLKFDNELKNVLTKENNNNW